MLSVTATELPRVLECGGSVNLPCDTSAFKDNLTRQQGVAAHWVVEQVVQHNMTTDELIDRQAPNDVYIDGEMIEYLTPYLQEAKHPNSEIEKDVSFIIGNVAIKARTDCAHTSGNLTTISDLKYGWRIVDPDNWTMKAYAIGANITNFVNTTLKIFQPRPYHKDGFIRSITFTSEEMEGLYNELQFKLKQSLAENKLKTGPHCTNCKKQKICPAARMAGYNTVDVSTDLYVDDIPDEELSLTLDELRRASEHIKNLLESYEEEAFARVRNGRVIPNYFTQLTGSRMTWKENVTPEFIKAITGDDKLVKEQLLTPLQTQKLGVNVDAFTYYKSGSMKLVREDANKRAAKIFKGV